jgi:hypothetical protein
MLNGQGQISLLSRIIFHGGEIGCELLSSRSNSSSVFFDILDATLDGLG